MKVLVVGSGGREHTLVHKIKQSPKVKKIYVASGNGRTAQIAENITIKETEIGKIVNFAKKEKIDLTVVGPEIPLSLGIVDKFEELGLKIFGPTQKAAQIESSKAFCKELLQKYKIPCGKSQTFDNYKKAANYLDQVGSPIVVKASGLAAGKGVIVCQNKEEALSALDKIMKDRAFGEAGDEIVIEEFLEGREVSVLAFCDGKTIRLMVPVCDHKRVFDNDEGPNTGGMGAYSPPKFYTKELGKQILNKIFLPTLTALKKEGIKYKGVLYGGLIITKEGPKVLEFNCRFGDPETQVILPKLKNDLVEILEAVVDEELDEIDINWDPQFCITVVLASGGYPGKYETGEEIKGLDEVDSDIVVFHAGTKSESDEILTSGGRVLNVTTLGKDVQSARKKVYENIKKIKFKNMHYRKDIGNKENF